MKAPASTGNALGALIQEEARRAEADFNAVRAQGQSVLTISGVLITALGAFAKLANPEQGTHSEPWMVAVAVLTGLAVSCFAVAVVAVLSIYLPTSVNWPDLGEFETLLDGHWESNGWDKEVARVTITYAGSVRAAHKTMTDRMTVAITFEVIGIALSGAMFLVAIAP